MLAMSHREPIETEADRKDRLAEEMRLLDEAEAEAELLGTIPADEVRAWVESWGTANELPPPEPRR
jgi:predicted transcriptional regulator